MAGKPLADIESNINRTAFPFPVYNLSTLGQAQLAFDQDALEIYADIDNSTGRVNGYATYRDWYSGTHGAIVSDRQAAVFEASGIPFADNFCDLIVDAPVRRLVLTGFEFTPENQTASDVTQEILDGNRNDTGSARLHHNAIKLGDSFAILDFDKSRNLPTISYNRADIIRPEYDDDTGERMLWVAKLWTTTEKSEPFNPIGGVENPIQRLNLYFPDRVEKYYRVGDGGDWLAFMDVNDILWPVPWIDESTNEPLGIPVFHFKNKTLDGSFGVSEIRKAIPQQAMLNKMLLDLDLIMDTQGYPQRWAVGVNDTSNSEGSTTTFDSDPGSVWHTDNENAKFGQFNPAEVTGALASISMLVMHMSASNATPINDLLTGGRVASGESLKMQDTGLSDKVDEKQGSFGNAWEDLIRYAHKLRNVFGEGVTAVDLSLTDIAASWKDTAPRNDKSMVEILRQLVELGASKRWALGQSGMIDNVSEVMEEREMEQDQESDAQLRSITRGTQPMVGGE